jgi:hypothetical protein
MNKRIKNRIPDSYKLENAMKMREREREREKNHNNE